MQLPINKLTRFRTQPSDPYEIRYNCPHCGDADGKLYVNIRKGLWTCFRCEEHGTVAKRDILLVLCSTLDERRRGIELGATMYLVKPTLPTTLPGALQAVIKSRRI